MMGISPKTGTGRTTDSSRLRHDLRSPINLVVGYAEILREDVEDPARAAERAALDEVLAAAREALGRIDGVFAMAAAETANTELAALEAALRGPRDRILAAASMLAASDARADHATWNTDVARIRAAAESLVGWFAVGPARDAPKDRVPGGPDAASRPWVPRILVVDDLEDNRIVLERRLRKQGYEVGCAADGEEALRELAARPYDLVLLDILMPGMDGFTVLERMRDSGDLSRIPVVVVSAMDDLSSVVRCIEMGAADHLPKPFEPVILKARVAACLEKKRLRDAEVEVIRGLEMLAGAARSLETGTFEPGCLQEIARRTDGLGDLARVFGSMAVEVAGREQRLRGQVEDLRRVIAGARVASGPAIAAGGPSILQPGAVFAGRFEVLAHVGTGGMGTVYRCRDRELSEEVALKILHPRALGTGGEGSLDRFKSEIRLARRITHRNIVRSHDFGTWENVHYLTMELVNGITLRELLDRSGRMEVPGVLAIANQLSEALGVAHGEGVIHRDIKPANLILDEQGILKIMDFGVARLSAGPSEFTMAGSVVGTPRYMAPEQILSGKLDERTDLYAVGVVLFECLTGRLPFDDENPLAVMTQVLRDPAPSPGDVVPGIPPALSGVVVRLLAKQPENRYPNAAALHRDLALIR
jgi:DNA-binding response OmpR family regulator